MYIYMYTNNGKKSETFLDLTKLPQILNFKNFKIFKVPFPPCIQKISFPFSCSDNEILHDTGFDIFPELGRPRQWVSESVFGFAFACFVVWTLTPFVTSKKRFYTVILYAR